MNRFKYDNLIFAVSESAFDGTYMLYDGSTNYKTPNLHIMMNL